MKLLTRFFIFTSVLFCVMISFSSFRNDKQSTYVSCDEKTNCHPRDTSDDLRLVIVNQEYSLEIPKHFIPDTSLNSDASLGYSDYDAETYVIVIDEVKSEFIDTCKAIGRYDKKLSAEKNYRKVKMEDFSKTVAVLNEPVIKPLVIQGYEAEEVSFSGSVEGIDVPIYYKVLFLYGEGKFYFVMTWTLDSLEMQNDLELDNLLRSFRIVKPAKEKQ